MSAESKKAMKQCLKRTTISRRTLRRRMHDAEEKSVEVKPGLTGEQESKPSP
jgi:hypothetical protein